MSISLKQLPLVEINLKQFPKAFKVYADHFTPQPMKAATLAQHQSSLAGTALLLPRHRHRRTIGLHVSSRVSGTGAASIRLTK